MSNTKRGLKKIEEDLSHEGYNPIIDGFTSPDAPTWSDFFWNPFNRKHSDKDGYTAVSIAVWTFLLTVIGCMLFSMVYYVVLFQQLTTPTSVSPFIVALVGALLTVGPMMWTFDTDFRIHTIPGLVLTSLGTTDLGLVATLIMLVGQFAGYGLGGWFAYLLNGGIVPAVSLIDNVTTASGFWLSGACSTVIIFVYLYNNKFEFHKEYEVDNHTRAAHWTGIFQFTFILAFFSLGLRTLNPGLAFAAGIANGNNWQFGGVPSINDGLWHTLFVLFVPTVIAFGLYWAASGAKFLSKYDLRMYVMRNRNDKSAPPDYEQTSARVGTSYGATARNRKLDASF